MRIRRTLAMICAGLMLAGSFCEPVFAKSSSEIEKELNSYKEELSESQQKSDELTEQIQDTKEQVDELLTEIESLSIQMDQYRDEMMLRIKYFYEETPENSIVEAMVGAESFSDFLNRMEYMQTIYDYDSDQLDAFSALITESQEKESQLEETMDELSDLLAEQEALQKDLEGTISKKEKELQKAKETEAAARAYMSGSGGGRLTRYKGEVYYNGHRETYYSQRVLPGGGLKIPGRHVASDGTIRDKDGYICVASVDLPYGSIVETSLGTGKVYDSGCPSGTIDIYTDW